MRMSLFAAALFAMPAMSFAAYDSSWHKEQFWSGEYPAGFSVVKENVEITARSAMDKAVAPAIKCTLPYRAVFHPWNQKRNALNKARYMTASKIVAMVAKEDFVYRTDSGTGKSITVKKGQVIDWLIYLSEGMFKIRFEGKVYDADQDLLSKVEEVADSAYQQDEWLRLTCKNGKRAWIFTGDLVTKTPDGESKFIPGFADVGPGLTGYGEARDLTRKEAEELAKQ